MRKIIKTKIAKVSRHSLRTTWEGGQLLLILIMIMALAITIVLTITFSTRTDTQLTKLEEDNQKAIAAAEAGIDYTLKNGNTPVSDLTTVGNLSSTISSGNSTVTTASSTVFVSPVLSSGEAFTFYLGTYSPSTKLISDPGSDNNITIAYNSSSTAACDSIVLEIAVLKTTGVTRYIADTGFNFNSSGTQIGTSVGGPFIVDGVTYQCITSAIPVTLTGARIMIVRFISVSGGPTNTSLGFASSTGVNLPVSGQTVTSQATTKAGVTKKVQLFQSYPQIPAEFFYTSF